MKKTISITLALLCALSLCACSSGGDNDAAESSEAVYTADYGELYFEANGVEFGIMDEAEGVLASLGEPTGTFESESCAYQGMDKYYYYDGFEVMTNEIDGVERITAVTLADDTVQNPQGVKIGMDMDDALSLMDDIEYTQSGDTYKFVVGSAMLRLRAGEDNTVSAAEYVVAASDEG